MADDTTTTLTLQEQLELQKKIAEVLASKDASLGNILKKSERLTQDLQERLGEQYKYATEAEKLALIHEDQLRATNEAIRLATRLKELEDEKSSIAAGDKEKRIKLEKEINKLESAGVAKNEKELDVLRKQQKELKKQKKENDKLVKIQGDAEKIAENRLQQSIGLTNQTEDFADVLIDAIADGKDLGKAFEGMSKAVAKTATAANMFKTAKNFLTDFTDSAIKNATSMDGLLMRYQEMGKQLTKATGAQKRFGDEAKNLVTDMNEQNFVLEETERAYETLFTQSKAFVSFTETSARAALTEQALQFSRLGVSADTFSTAVDNLNKVFRDTPDAINATTEELSNFARAMGVGPNKMIAEFNNQMPLLARYGKQYGIDMFKELAITAHRAGLEMADLVNIAGTFDSFEGAAEAAGKLNFILGGPLLNSMDLLNATESERINLLREGMIASGKSFDQLGRFEKDLIAKTLGASVDVAQKLFNDDNISTIEEATAAIHDQAGAMGSLGDQAQDATTLAQKAAAADEAQLEAMKGLAGTMEKFHETIIEIKRVFYGLAPTIALVFSVIQGGAWVKAFTTNMGKIGASFKSFRENASKLFEPMRNGLKDLGTSFRAKWDDMSKAAGEGITAMKNKWTSWQLWEKTKTMAQAAWLKTKKIAEWAWERTKLAAQWAWKKIGLLADAALVVGIIAAEKVAKTAFWVWEKAAWLAQWAWTTAGSAAAAAATFLPWLANPITLIILGIVAALGVLWAFWEPISEGFMKGVSAIGDVFIALGDTIVGVFKLAFEPIAALIDAAASVFDFLPGVGDIANSLRDFSFSVAGFADGGTNIQQGPAIVGERGPELVTLGQGSNVITNENLQKSLESNPLSAIEKLAAEIGNMTEANESARTFAGSGGTTTVNITVELDGDVLAKHTEEVAMSAMEKAFAFTV